MTGAARAAAVDKVLRDLHRQLSQCERESIESAHVAGVIGPMTHLYRLKPINEIHEQRLRDFLEGALRANEKRLQSTPTTVAEGK